MMPINLELGLSASSSSGAQASLGDFVYNNGGFKLKTEQLIIAGVFALLGLVLFFRLKA